MQYMQQALRTESKDYTPASERLAGQGIPRILHASLGLSTEAAEVMDAVKKHLFYGKPLDRVNLMEEAGDIFWYLAILCDELGVSFEDVMARNVAKLQSRYHDKFSEDAANVRDIVREREILEGGV